MINYLPIVLLMSLIGQHYARRYYYTDESPDFENSCSSLRRQIILRDKYITRLESRLRWRNANYRPSDGLSYSNSILNYAQSYPYPHESEKPLTDEEMLDEVIPPVTARMSNALCNMSCNYLKDSRVSKNILTQYLYLLVCNEGCSKSIPCLIDNYCLPVMKENPDYFIQCVSKCELFMIAPKIFIRFSKRC